VQMQHVGLGHDVRTSFLADSAWWSEQATGEEPDASVGPPAARIQRWDSAGLGSLVRDRLLIVAHWLEIGC
jgi:hypothetical protein